MPQPESSTARILRTLSLEALRGFEAAARHLSFTAAAEELALTQSAVSKQVKMVEESLGTMVFVRGSRTLTLTPAGQRLHEGVTRILGELVSVVEDVAQRERAHVSITVPPSFAAQWLVGRLAAHQAFDPGVDVRIHASDRHVDLDREGFDLAIRLARPEDMPASSRLLAHERLMLVAAPALADRVRVAGDLRRLPHLVFHHPIERFPGMSWRSWYERLGLGVVAMQPVLQFSRYEDMMAAAADGLGVAIGRAPLLLPMLRRGQLKVVLPHTSTRGLSYHLMHTTRLHDRPEVRRFEQWLERLLCMDELEPLSAWAPG